MLSEQIEKDYLEAYKAKDESKVSVLRMLRSAIKNFTIEKRQAANDEDVIKIVRKEIKQRQESLAEFQKGGRDELAAKENQEIEVLKTYLPEEISEEELTQIIKTKKNQLGISELNQMGQLIGAVVAETKGRADGSVIARLAREVLASNE